MNISGDKLGFVMLEMWATARHAATCLISSPKRFGVFFGCGAEHEAGQKVLVSDRRHVLELRSRQKQNGCTTQRPVCFGLVSTPALLGRRHLSGVSQRLSGTSRCNLLRHRRVAQTVRAAARSCAPASATMSPCRSWRRKICENLLA